jgi:competence protein ComFC
MRCLMCDRELGYGSLTDILFADDPLCHACRVKWKKKKIRFEFEGHRLRSSYVYNEAFSACLIRYKELGDEALKDAFLFEDKNWFRRTYRGYTPVIMPSAKEKEAARGFCHLAGMFGCTEREILSPFVKLSDRTQKGSTRAERLAMSANIGLKEDAVLPGRIVLCDDVITTGSTLRGALKALEGYRGKIEIYTVSASSLWFR